MRVSEKAGRAKEGGGGGGREEIGGGRGGGHAEMTKVCGLCTAWVLLPSIQHESGFARNSTDRSKSINPFIAPSCKISGLKNAHIHSCKRYI